MGGVSARKTIVCGIGNPLDPLSTRVVREVEPGRTARSYACDIWPLLPDGRHVVVAVDGEYVGNDEQALATVLGPGQSMVLTVVPGKGGGKNIFSTVSMIALMVAAPYVGSLVGNALVGTAAWGPLASTATYFGTNVAGIVGGAFALGSSALISAFVDTGAVNPSASSATSSLADSPSWSDAPNPVVEGGPWPAIYGRAKCKPIVLSWNKQYEGSDQYLNWLGGIADHTVDSIDEIYINGNPISFYDNVTVEKRLGALDQTAISFFNETISEKTVNMKLSTAWSTARTDGNSSQGIGVVLCFSNGLGYVSDSGAMSSASVTVEMQYRKVGDTDWVDWQTVTITDATSSALYKQYRKENVDTAGAQFDIRVKFTTDPASGIRYRNTCYFVGIHEIVYDAFCYPGRTVLGLKIKANDLLSSSTSLTVECIVTRSTVQVYDGAAWSTQPANYPAWAAWDFLYNQDYGGCVPTKRIIYEDFLAWAEWLATKSLYRVNICIDSLSTHKSWMDQIALLGRGSVVQLGSKFTCIVERPEPVPAQRFMFNVANIRRASFGQKLLSTEARANCIEVTYKDKDADYSEQTLTWYGQDFNTSPEQTKATQVKLVGCDNTEQALSHAESLLKKNRYLTNTSTFGGSVDAIGTMPGDVIDVQHDVPQWGFGGLIEATTANVTAGTPPVTTATVTLDREVDMVPGTSYAIQVKLSDDTRLEYPVKAVTTATTTDTLIIDGGWDPEGQPEPDALYQFGPVGAVSKAFTVLKVARTTDFTRTIAGLEYREEVFDDAVTVPSVVNQSSLPGVAGLVANETFDVRNGVPVPRVDLAWRGAAMTWTAAYRRLGESTWIILGKTSTPSWSIASSYLEPGTSYEFRVIAGSSQNIVPLLYNGGPTPPDVTGPYTFLQGGMLYLAADPVDMPWDTIYEARKGSSWATGQLAGAASQPLFQINGPGTYFVAAKCGSVYSANPTAITVTDSGLVANVIATSDERATGWAGARTTGLDIVGTELWLLGTGDFLVQPDVYAIPDIWTIGGVTPSGIYNIPAGHVVDIGREDACNVLIDYTLRGAGIFDDLYDDPDVYSLKDIYGGFGAFVRATPQVRTYRSGAWGSWVSYVPGQYFGQKFEVRMLVESFDTGVIAILESFSFSVDVPDRVDWHKSVSVPAGGLDFTHSPAFHATPATVVQILSATQGDDAVLTSETINGGHLVITNGGVPVARTVNLIHQGY